MKKIILIFLALLPILHGCYSAKLSANVQVNSQLGNPIMLDFVFIFDQPAMEDLQKVTSSQWFSKRAQYKMDLEMSEKIQILNYELVPGQRFHFAKFRPNSKSLGLIIYASYLSQGDHRIVLKDFTNVDVKLEKEDFVVTVPKDSFAPNMPSMPTVPAMPTMPTSMPSAPTMPTAIPTMSGAPS